MSQLNVNAIYDAAGGDSVDVFSENAAKVWVDWNDSAGTPTIATDFGVASLTDEGTGDVSVVFDTAFTSANYAVSIASSNYCEVINAQATGSCRVKFANTTPTFQDTGSCCVVIFGDQ